MRFQRTFEYAVCVIGVLLEIITFIIIFQCIKKLLFSNKHRIKDKYIFVQTVDKGQKKKRIKKKNVHISFDPSIRFGTILSLICCFLTSCGYLSSMFLIVDTEPNKINQLLLNSSFLIILQIKSFTWHFGRILVNFVFVQRLQSSFKDTTWMYPKRVFHCLRFMLLLLLVLSFIASVIRALILSQNTEMTPRILITLHICFVLLDIIFFVLLTVLYHKKVFELIKAYYVLYINSVQNIQTLNLNDINLEIITAETSLSTDILQPEARSLRSDERMDVNTIKSLNWYQHISDSRECDEDLCETIYEERRNKNERRKHYRYKHTEKELINSMVQQSTLVSVSVMASMLALMCSIIAFSGRFKEHQRSPSITAAFYGNALVVVECFINALCLYLQFPFAFKLYRLLCCAHKICLRCVAKCVEKSNRNM